MPWHYKVYFCEFSNLIGPELADVPLAKSKVFPGCLQGPQATRSIRRCFSRTTLIRFGRGLGFKFGAKLQGLSRLAQPKFVCPKPDPRSLKTQVTHEIVCTRNGADQSCCGVPDLRVWSTSLVGLWRMCMELLGNVITETLLLVASGGAGSRDVAS